MNDFTRLRVFGSYLSNVTHTDRYVHNPEIDNYVHYMKYKISLLLPVYKSSCLTVDEQKIITNHFSDNETIDINKARQGFISLCDDDKAAKQYIGNHIINKSLRSDIYRSSLLERKPVLENMNSRIFNLIETLKNQLLLQRTNFFAIGEQMVQLQLEFTSGFIVINEQTYLSSEPIKLLCEVFDMRKSNVYNYINLYTNFANQEEYQDYSLSQLIELLPLSSSELKQIKISPTLSVRKIREIVKAFKGIEPPEQTNISDHEEVEEQEPDQEVIEDDPDQILTYEKVVSEYISSHLNFIQVNIQDKEQQIILHPKNMKLRGHLEQMELDHNRTEQLKDNLLKALKKYIN